ncbi:M23 family metallopeptidase [Microbacterium halophytorum]|uniref:M23 family metallopeptidase n=1 Tax=Microbacterium halophytorum TaxID=2067568 RepID=UPI000CFD2738|nr:M23 family metallopeptidase [Microbacterium halophytorum]
MSSVVNPAEFQALKEEVKALRAMLRANPLRHASTDRGSVRMKDGSVIRVEGLFELVGRAVLSGQVDISGTLGVVGPTTITGDTSIDGDLAITGDTSLEGTFDQTGTYNVQSGAGFNVRSGGDVTVHDGGEVVVNGPEPITLKRFNILGSDVAAMQLGTGPSYIFGNDGIVIIQGETAVDLVGDAFAMRGLPDGAGDYLVTADASGQLYKTPRSGDGGDPGDPGDPPVLNPEGYIWPVSASQWGVSSSWQGHKDRNPPSAEPGTDVECPIGTSVYAPADGEITQVNLSNANATGRYVAMKTDGGAWFRFLHLSGSPVTVGQQVSQGDVVAVSGASGFGSDYGYGAHCHITFWSGPSASMPSFGATEDFEAYMAAQDAA